MAKIIIVSNDIEAQVNGDHRTIDQALLNYVY